MACRGASPDAGARANRFLQLLVAPVDVLPEVELPVSHVRGEVHDVHRDLLRQPDALVVASTLHRRLNLLYRPAKHPLRQLRRSFETDAAMARGAVGLREERFGRRVVQVDVVRVREEELYESE